MSIETMKLALEALEDAHGVVDELRVYGVVEDAIYALRQAIEQAEKPSEGGDCDSPSWCKQYGKCHRKVVGAPTLANCIDKRQEPWVWMPAPIKTQWGHDMVVADLAIDKDHTVSVYCERDQTARVEAMFNRGC